MAKKYLSFERLAEYDTLLKEVIAAGDDNVKAYADDKISTLVGDEPVSTQISEAINDFEAITNDEIDAICNAIIYTGEEVEL